MKAGSLGRARFSLQAALTAVFFTAPWLTYGGRRLFGVDAPDGALRLFGARIPAAELFTALLAVLCLLFVLLWITAALGRLWCGWLCPQSVVSDLAARFGGSGAGGVVLHLVSAVFASSAAATFILYFVAPSQFFSAGFFTTWSLGLAAFLLIALVGYLDMAWVGRRFCLSVCPYGKLLTVLTDRDAVEVRLSPARAGECIDCKACEKACPMDLRVRGGAGADCNRCGRCIDACRVVMKNRGGGLVEYALPEGGWFKGVVLRPRHLPLLLLAVGAASAFAWRAATDRPVRLAIRATPEVAARATSGGRSAVFLTARIAAPAGSYSLDGTDATSGAPLELRGDLKHIEVGGGGAVSVKFAIIATQPAVRARFGLCDAAGNRVAEAEYDVSGTGAVP